MKKKRQPDRPQTEQLQTEQKVDGKPKTVLIKNTMNQVVSFSVRRPDGKLAGVMINANSSVVWPELSDYGPEVSRLIKNKVLRVESAP